MSIEEPQRLGFPKIDHGVIVSRTKFPSDLGEYFCCHRSPLNTIAKSPQSAIEASHLRKGYVQRVAVDDVFFAVNAGVAHGMDNGQRWVPQQISVKVAPSKLETRNLQTIRKELEPTAPRYGCRLVRR